MRSYGRTALIILFCLGIFIPPAAAQDNTPQPNQSFILGWMNEVIFPQAVRYSVTLALPLTDVARATLRIQPAGGEAVSIDLDLAQSAIVSAPYTELAYVWEIPRDNTPRLFQSVSITWQVVSDGDVVAQVEDSFIFTDQRTLWTQGAGADGRLNLIIPEINASSDAAVVTAGEALAPSEDVTNATPAPEATSEVSTLEPLAENEIVTPASGLLPSSPQPTSVLATQSGARLLLSGLEPVYDLLAANTSTSPSFNVLVYTNTFPPGCIENAAGDVVAVGPISGVEIPCDSTLANLIIRNSGYDLVQSSSSSLNLIEVDLTGYLVEGFYRPLWAGKDVPTWFVEGLKQFYTDTLKTTWYPPLLAAARSDSLFGLQQMNANASASVNASLWRSQSYGMLLYLANELGVSALFDLAREVADGESFTAEVETALGRSLASFLSGFERWVFTSQAASAFGFTPYQAATLTPTPSRTPTFTPTPTATLTHTPTLTPTVTGVLTNTPTVTPLPSSTPTPRPPSPTPRPAGSLNTPTPTPVVVQTVNPLSALSNPIVALGVLTLGLVIIAAFALVLIRFRGK